MGRSAAVFLFALALVFPLPTWATTYVVKPDGTGDFPTIQEAIAAAEDWDIIELTDGIFTGDGNRDISNMDKAVFIHSQSGNPEACMIDCEASYADLHRGFFFSILGSTRPGNWGMEGITITHGYAVQGGAVFCADGCDPTFSYCVFEVNHALEGGGAVYCDASFPTIVDCQFVHNSTEDGPGGAIACGPFSAPLIGGCTFRSNAGVQGGAIHCKDTSPEAVIVSCTFYNNLGGVASSICCDGYSFLRIENTIVAFGWKAPPVSSNDISTVTLSCCDIYGNEYGDWVGSIADQYGINGNISEDPLFCDAPHGKFYLDQCSPCAPFSPPNPECYLIGAWPVGCGGTATETHTWSSVKVRFGR